MRAGYKYKSYIVTTNEDTGATGSKNYGVHGSTADKSEPKQACNQH